jgi:hypothetical protein
MIPMSINFLEDDELWFKGEEFHPDAKIELAVSPHGTASGKPTVLMRITAEGKSFVVPTTARLFCTMAKMIEARYPDLFEGD